MRVIQLLHRGLSTASIRFEHRLNTSRKLAQPSESNVVFKTIKLHWRLLPKLEVDIALACRDALRYFFLVFMLVCLYSTVTDHP
jgi:hypothetical protein